MKMLNAKTSLSVENLKILKKLTLQLLISFYLTDYKKKVMNNTCNNYQIIVLYELVLN